MVGTLPEFGGKNNLGLDSDTASYRSKPRIVVFFPA